MDAGPVLETQLAPGAAPPERRFSAGAVVGKTLEVWWRRLGPFTLMSAAVYGPLALLVPGLSWAALGAQRGTPPDVDELVLALVAAEPVLATGLLTWLAASVGLLLLVVPGVVFLVASAVAVPAAAVERLGPIAAIRRSFALTRGCRWTLFAAGLAVLVAFWLLAAVAQVAATLAVSLVVPPRHALLGSLAASQLGNVLFAALPAVGIAVAYHELRLAKEGVDAEALARVFE